MGSCLWFQMPCRSCNDIIMSQLERSNLILSTLTLYTVRNVVDWEQYQGTLRWRHNGCDSVPNHQPRHWLLNRLFRHRSKKYQSSASLAFVRGIHRGSMNSPHKWPVTRKMLPFDDVIVKCTVPVTTKWSATYDMSLTWNCFFPFHVIWCKRISCLTFTLFP